MKSRFGETAETAEFYRVTGTLPPSDNSPQYRIRSDDERHDRVATQDTLEAAGSFRAAALRIYRGRRPTIYVIGAADLA